MNIKIKHIRRFDKLKILEALRFINSWKRKVKWLVSLNPTMLFIGYIIFIIIPYIPNIPLYLILVNKGIDKWIKIGCFIISVIFSIFYNLVLLYYLFG